MSEDLRKAEHKQLAYWFFISLLPAIPSLFLSAYVIGNGSFEKWLHNTPVWMGSMPIIIFAAIWLGTFTWGYGRIVFLQSNWKTLSTGRRAAMFKVLDWEVCDFQSLGDKRQDYLDKVVEGMEKMEFKRLEGIEPSYWPENRLLKGSDLIFEDPYGTYVGIRAVSVYDDLRVGFSVSGKPTTRVGKKAWSGLTLSMTIAFFICVLSIYILGHGVVPWTNVPDWMTFIPVIIFFSVFIPTFYIFMKRLMKEWLSPVREFLIKIGESMGSKQITPFKKILVKIS